MPPCKSCKYQKFRQPVSQYDRIPGTSPGNDAGRTRPHRPAWDRADSSFEERCRRACCYRHQSTGQQEVTHTEPPCPSAAYGAGRGAHRRACQVLLTMAGPADPLQSLIQIIRRYPFGQLVAFLIWATRKETKKTGSQACQRAQPIGSAR